ncbi:MAG: superoxide dismutase [Sediminibacterium sp. Gen4]|jgi:superoxide dismutase, Fe-Mn family|uniref:superoxide dismutase n=1 Tax=unclassified Sediminibacterium TaxID=2635961 RepID=UPI0015C10F47|nr:MULTISPECIES: superoxide dismutase [unclassified Sediminibacterium]MBW0161716.1 superoxide dismutase [Sediminibacterium sp.]MBW0163136.1 superoxide dismutase [Sediminibacterium sp.]NWK67129.1 superoxide dismutase [Sediminibacterium sp. Gen4]
MNHSSSRRRFIQTTGKAGLALGLSGTILPSLVSASVTSGSSEFVQQPLPYAFNALEPVIDTTTMDIHYSKHAAAYAKALSEACAAENVNTNNTKLESVLRNISKYSTKMRNNAGGHYNHEMFWQTMKPGGTAVPSGQLGASIVQAFGSFETFKTQFADAAKSRFGSGWAWLIINSDNALSIISTPNQDNPLMDISETWGQPLLGLDVWEHAYYLKYQNRRPDYINAWWNVVNWDVVESRMKLY